MLSIKQFSGKIGNRKLSHFKNRVDHTLMSTAERIDKVKEILEVEKDGVQEWNSEFWCEVVDRGCCKTDINTSDALYSETDVAIYLENMASYILAVDEKPKAQKVKIYDSYAEFDRIRKEKEKIENLSAINGADESFLMFRENKNYKKEKKQVITAQDIKDSSILKDYEEARLDYLRMYQTELVGLGLSKADKHKKNLVKKHLGMFKVDMIDVKNAITQPIVWKNPLPDSGEIDWDEIDFLDKSHVKELLRMKAGSNLQEDIHCILLDFNNMLAKVKLSDKQKQVLKLWKQGKTQTEIGAILNVSQQMIYKQIDTISSKIVAVAEKELEEWYYLNINKGKYKVCNKCGEVRLITRFQANKNKCKDC